jgi:hypothetical protein
MSPNSTRRAMLKGLGSAVALPLLSSLSSSAFAASPLTNTGKPIRLIWLSYGYGPSEHWYPTEAGPEYNFTPGLEPLAKYREDFSVLSNLTNTQSVGFNGHAGCTTYLTSADVSRTIGREFHNDISCDQIAAATLGKDLRFPSLTLSADANDVAGVGPGNSLAWDVFGNPIYGESDPVRVFSQLFGDGGMTLDQQRRQLRRRQSVLDTVASDARSIAGHVSRDDKQKLEEYFQSVRDIEGRLKRNADWVDRPKPNPTMPEPGTGLTGTAYVDMMFDLIVAAMQTDSTRVATFRMPTNSLLDEIADEVGARVGAHNMTHWRAVDSDEYKVLVCRERKLSAMFGSLIDKLRAAKDPDGGTLLDNSLVVMGSSLRTGHGRYNLPTLFAGHGGGEIRQGQHRIYEEDVTPLSNLWLGMMRQAGVPVESFADSTGVLDGVFPTS